jgi:hypothetical protein
LSHFANTPNAEAAQERFMLGSRRMRKSSPRRKPVPRKSARRPKKRPKIGQIFTGDQALHELFREQAAAMLENAEIGEEERQTILAAMTCPCCGAGSMSVSVKLKKPTRFVAEES